MVEIMSPMVGTFYASPAPDAPAFAREGDHVKKGQTLCIVEAMKLMNEIKSECDGTILEIAVENAEAIEYDQLLFLIEKD
jgi:acetyl-CoA carboxylase biotin carboxyl carrier protein